MSQNRTPLLRKLWLRGIILALVLISVVQCGQLGIVAIELGPVT